VWSPIAQSRHDARRTGEPLLVIHALRKVVFAAYVRWTGVDPRRPARRNTSAIIGPNGSGKSTLINCRERDITARDAGSIRFYGRENRDGRPAHRIARGPASHGPYQIPRPFAHLTVRDNVALTAMFGGLHLDATSGTGRSAKTLARIHRTRRRRRPTCCRASSTCIRPSSWSSPARLASQTATGAAR